MNGDRRMLKREFLGRCSACIAGVVLSPRLLALQLDDQSGGSESSSDDLWKWSKEGEFAVPSGSGLKCVKCPNECILLPGSTGRCRNRVNHQGKMFSIGYGNPCAVHIDPIEKKPFFHFLPTTRAFSLAVAGCNLACLNCQNWQISQVSPKETDNYDLMPAKAVEECLQSGSESIAYTYSEPTTFYEYAYDIATLARAKGIRNVWKSNGYIQEEPLRKLCKVLDAANIDLKSFSEDTYKKLNAGRLAPVLRSLKIFREEGVWLEITNLIIPGWSDDLEMIRSMCTWIAANGLRDVPVHFTRFTPLYKLAHLPATPVSTLEKARDIALEAGLRYVYLGNVPGHAAENTFCHSCKLMILERRGFSIVSNAMEQGVCKYCRTPIPGVWS